MFDALHDLSKTDASVITLRHERLPRVASWVLGGALCVPNKNVDLALPHPPTPDFGIFSQVISRLSFRFDPPGDKFSHTRRGTK